jgi:hypothetical protein
MVNPKRQQFRDRLRHTARLGYEHITEQYADSVLSPRPEEFGSPDLFVWSRNSNAITNESIDEGFANDIVLAGLTINLGTIVGTNAYIPLQSEPDMYLEFASFGNRSVQLRGQVKETDLATEVGWAIELVRRYGVLGFEPLSEVSEFLQFQELGKRYGPTVLDVILETQIISLVLLAHQFANEGGQELAHQVADRQTLVYNIDAKLIDSCNKYEGSKIEPIASRDFWDEFQRSRISVDEYRYVVADYVSTLISNRLTAEGVTSGIGRSAIQKHKIESHISWETNYVVDSLRGAIWVQVANHVLGGSSIRRCRNTTCSRGLFRTDNPNSSRRYCDDKCKEQQNNRVKYKKHPERYSRKKS